jgi:hypothetical protein
MMRSEDEKCRDLECGVTDVRVEAPNGVLLIAVPARTTLVLKVSFGLSRSCLLGGGVAEIGL